VEEVKHYTRLIRGPKVVIDCSKGKILTKQSFKQESDINFIVARYQRTGMLVDPGMVGRREAIFADFSEVGDFQSAQERIVKGREAFDSLSAEVRSRFQNEPGKLLDFMANEANKKEAQDLGIIPKDDPVPGDPVVDSGTVAAPVAPVVDSVVAPAVPEPKGS